MAEHVAAGSISLDDPDSVPKNLSTEWERIWLSLPTCRHFLLHRMLGLLAIMREPGTDDTIASILGDRDVLPHDVADLRRHVTAWLIFSGDGYALAHDRLRTFLIGSLGSLASSPTPANMPPGEMNAGKFRPADLCALHEDLVNFYDVAKASHGNSAAGSLDRMTDSGFRFLAWHLGQIVRLNTLDPETEDKHVPARERLYSLLQSEEYRRSSVARFQTYDTVLADLHVGIEVFVARHGTTPLDDARLCWLALKAGEVHSNLRTGLLPILQQARDRTDSDPSVLKFALAYVRQLTDLTYYEAVCWLLWCECARPGASLGDQLTCDRIEMLICDVDRRMGRSQVEAPPMEDILVPDLMAYLVGRLVQFVSIERIIRLLETKRDGISLRLIRRVAELAWRTEGPEADTLKNAALQLADTRTDLSQRTEAICEVAQVAAAAGDDATCQRLLCQAECAAESLNHPFHKYRLLETVTDAARRASNIEIGTRVLLKAIAIIPGISNKGVLAYAYAKAGLLAQTFLSASESSALFEKATISACAVQTVERRIEALSMLGHVLARAQRSEASHAAFGDALNLIQQSWVKDGSIVDIRKLGEARLLLGKDTAVSGHIDLALSIAESIPGANAEIFRDVATELARQGKMKEALTVANTPHGSWELALAKGGIPCALAEKGCIDEAFQVADTIVAQFRKRPLAEVAGALALQGHTARALDVFLHAFTLTPSTVVHLSHLRFIAQAYAVRGLTAKCRGVVALLPAPIKRGNIELYSRDVVASNNLAAALKYGNCEAVFAAAEEVTDSEKEVYVSVARVDALAQLGRTPEAIELAGAIQSSIPRAEALTRIAGRLVQHRLLTEAQALLVEAERMLEVVSDSFADRDKAETMTWIATVYQQLGDTAHSSCLLSRVENMALQYRTDPYTSGRILSNLAGAFAKSGRTREMEGMIERTIKISLTLFDPNHRAVLVGYLVRQLVSAGMIQHCFDGSSPYVISPQLSRGLLSAQSWSEALREWRHGAALSGCRYLQAIRQSLLVGSSVMTQDFDAVSSVLGACITGGDVHRSSHIIRECPQLGLSPIFARRQTP